MLTKALLTQFHEIFLQTLTSKLRDSHLSDVEVEELHHQTVEAPVVDIGQAGDQVVLGITEPVQHEPLSL